MKVCERCGKNRNERFFPAPGSRICTSCQKWKRSQTTHANRVKKEYGLTDGDYETLIAAQDGVCAICGGARGYRLHVDHDHVTGFVRGGLCKRCNSHLLPAAQDDPEILRKAIEYLTDPPAFKVIGQKKADTGDE